MERQDPDQLHLVLSFGNLNFTVRRKAHGTVGGLLRNMKLTTKLQRQVLEIWPGSAFLNINIVAVFNRPLMAKALLKILGSKKIA